LFGSAVLSGFLIVALIFSVVNLILGPILLPVVRRGKHAHPARPLTTMPEVRHGQRLKPSP
jgi:hypothetical protein